MTKRRVSLAAIIHRTLDRRWHSLAETMARTNALWARIERRQRDRANAADVQWMAAYERHWQLEGPHA